MGSYSIQAADKSHQSAIKQLIREADINPLGLKWPRFRVALDDTGSLIGCGQVKPHRDGSRELASIAVAGAWRRQGIASALIEELLAREILPLWLTCMSNLIPFYEQFGFIEVTERQEMPTYFRRVHRLFPLFSRLTHTPGYLAVMVNRQTP